MTRVIPKHDFSTKFQTKLIRVFYQFPDESRDIIESIDASVFDLAPMRWVVKKMQKAFAVSGIPVTDTMLEYDAIRDARLGLIPDGHIPAYARTIGALHRRVPEKSFLLDKAHEYNRYVSLRDATISLAETLQNPAQVNWSKIDDIINKQRQIGERSDGDLGQDFFGDVDQRVTRRRSFERTGIPTGMPIDAHLRHGGLPPKQLGVIMAPPGRGKTSILVWIGGSAIKVGKTVLYLSVELDEDMIAEKFDARFSKIRLQHLVSKEDSVRESLTRIARRYDRRLRIKFFPPSCLSVAKLRTFLKRLEASAFYPDLIVIDYADNMDLQVYGSGSNGDSDYGPLGKLYIALRGLAGECNIPIWTASQTSRLSLEKEDISLSDLADSFRKAMVADVIVGVAQTPAEQIRKVARLFTAKNRNGPAGKIDTIRFDTSRVRIWSDIT